jgi:hypothetical protein
MPAELGTQAHPLLLGALAVEWLIAILASTIVAKSAFGLMTPAYIAVLTIGLCGLVGPRPRPWTRPAVVAGVAVAGALAHGAAGVCLTAARPLLALAYLVVGSGLFAISFLDRPERRGLELGYRLIGADLVLLADRLLA